MQSIATSSAINDSGLFELSFWDERYLPFEGLGAICSLHFSLNNNFRQFNFDTISDVIIHMKYTSRYGGDEFRDLVNNSPAANPFLGQVNAISLAESRTGLFQAFSARHDFPTAWNRFIFPAKPGIADQVMIFDISAERFPYFTREYIDQGKKLMIKSVEVSVGAKSGLNYEVVLTPFIGATAPAIAAESLNEDHKYGGLYHIFKSAAPAQPIGNFNLMVRQQGNDFKSLMENELTDVLLIINYSLS